MEPQFVSDFGFLYSDSILFARQQIQSREQKDPHQINKVPVQAGDLDPIGEPVWIGLPHPCCPVPTGNC
jgi:hypothetical protein